jgi:hypothetical protein
VATLRSFFSWYDAERGFRLLLYGTMVPFVKDFELPSDMTTQ